MAKKMSLASQLEAAVAKRNVAAVKKLLAEGADPNSALIDAVLNSFEITQLLVAAGADVSRGNELGETPLFYARNAKIAALLVEAGAKINVKDEWGNTPLGGATSNGAVDVVKFLIERGADPNQGLLSGACLEGMVGIVEALLAGGADPNVANEDGVTPLMDAAQAGKKHCAAITRLLVAAGAKLEAKMSDGRFPLQWHATYGTPESVQVLIDAGADINQDDGQGETALASAIYEGRADTAAVLIGAGADPDRRISPTFEDPGRRGKTPRELARASRKPAVRALFK
jgi:ankyrin repeat protein